MLRIQTILVPIDFSFATDHALDVAHSLARDHQARLVLFAVAVPSQATMGVELPEAAGLPDATLSTPWPRAEHAFRQQLEPIAAAIVDVPVITQVCSGAPGATIVAAASEHNADLIVMGTQGRTGLSRLLLGSVAEYVLRHAPCPVLTIKPATEPHLQHEQSTGLIADARP
jgi:nucleotide-binding universal stress UspA family protein